MVESETERGTPATATVRLSEMVEESEMENLRIGIKSAAESVTMVESLASGLE